MANKTATIPIHKNNDLGIGIIKEILKDIELNINDYEKLIKKV